MEETIDPLPIQYSQRDPSWKKESLGFSENTIETFGCLLTASATVLTRFGLKVNPSELNKALKKANGFSGAYMYYQVLSNIYPVDVELMQCTNIPAPLNYIDSNLKKGLYPIVEVDSNPKNGFQNHWVVIYKKVDNDYWVSDPWSLSPHSELVSLTSRFGFAGNAQKIIKNIFVITPRFEIDIPVVAESNSGVVENNSAIQDENQNLNPIQNEGLNTSDTVPLELKSIPIGGKLKTIIDGLRVRNGPSLDSKVLTMVNSGTEFVSAGDLIQNGNITWQPIILYVATNCANERYVVPLE